MPKKVKLKKHSYCLENENDYFLLGFMIQLNEFAQDFLVQNLPKTSLIQKSFFIFTCVAIMGKLGPREMSVIISLQMLQASLDL
jgi:hypothetical protein